MQDGRLGLYYSQWGAYQLELDLLPGPELATQFARRQRAVSSWMWEPECEGACLIDHDERRLLLFCHCGADQSYRLATLAALARTWPGWRVEWAYDGLRQLKAAAGHVVDFAATWSGDPQAGEEWCDVLVTVVHQGRTRAHLVDSAEAVIRSGAGSLDEHRSAWPTITSCPGKVVAGVHLDLDDQTAGVWTSATLRGALRSVGQGWPGWHWSNWEDRAAEQARRVAGALTVPEPDLAAGLRALAAEFDKHQGVASAADPASLLLAVTDLSSAFTHHPTKLTDEEKAVVRTAIAALT
ncbi:unnamed protein product [[Actinomadura] parvosata subsp. kistnae]|uniref:Uncharacterized protein n=2 Tax=Nonomuraea TaxID=83681 RepID=A0A1V0A4G9_9ACTN|nr:hypothetical protein BKM31_30020 [Nonomuraea sp. ATCC 55076]SPL96398.1 unnamed protein product [Actinomadura parvosata subsp. kistnae]